MTHLDADVIVVGNGISGASCASLLAQADMQVIIIDAGTQKQHCQDPRVFAITPATRQILTTAHIWQQIDITQIGPFRKIKVWDEDGSGTLHFDCRYLCQPTLGYIIPMYTIQSALDKQQAQQKKITLIQPTSLIALKIEPNHVCVTISDQQQLQARLLIGADGIHSKVRTLSRIQYNRHEYRQSALTCIVNTQYGHQQIARQRFLKTGPLAFLPMADAHQCAIIWSTDPQHARYLLDIDEKKINRALAASFQYAAGDIKLIGQRTQFPLQHAQAIRYCQARLALIGDAAHSIHPLAGQGANLGVLDAASLAELVINARRRDQDIGRLTLLRRYERWRKSENQLMIMGLDGIKRLFEQRAKWLCWTRNLGLDIIDAIPSLKNQIMKKAMGLSGDLPEIVKDRY